MSDPFPMKKLLAFLFMVGGAEMLHSAGPAFQDLNANQFNIGGNKVSIKDGALLTNIVIPGLTVTSNLTIVLSNSVLVISNLALALSNSIVTVSNRVNSISNYLDLLIPQPGDAPTFSAWYDCFVGPLGCIDVTNPPLASGAYSLHLQFISSYESPAAWLDAPWAESATPGGTVVVDNRQPGDTMRFRVIQAGTNLDAWIGYANSNRFGRGGTPSAVTPPNPGF